MAHPGNPQPLSPVGQPVDAVAAVFSWTADAGRNYELQVARDAGFTDIAITLSAGAADTATLYDLLPSSDSTLFWRVRSVDTNGAGDWSAPASFVASGRAMAARPRPSAPASTAAATSSGHRPTQPGASAATQRAVESIDGSTSQALVGAAVGVGLLSFIVLMLILRAMV